MITEGKGEDVEEYEKEEESEKEEEPAIKKGKVNITKLPKSSTAIFTRRSKKKLGKSGSEVVFSKPPLTIQKTLK